MAHLEFLMHERAVTLLESTPTLVASLFRHLRGLAAPTAWRTAIVGSDTFRTSELQALVTARPASVSLYNGYGLSECTIESLVLDCTSSFAQTGSGLVPFGTPLPGVQAMVVDDRGRLLPPFAVGALRLSGAQVGLGYLADGELASADVFSPSGNGVGSFTTADLVHLDEDGCFHAHGRGDRQVKVDGHRVELGDVENNMLSASGVTGASACTLYDGRTTRLVAFYSGPVDAVALRATLQAKLPAPAVPAVLHKLDALPRNSNGKVDLPELLQLARSVTKPTSRPTAPLVPVSQQDSTLLAQITALWGEVLNQPVAVDRTFFDQGGTSLLVIVLHERLHALLPEAEFGVADLFHHPTVRGFVEFLQGPVEGSAQSSAQGTSVLADPARGQRREVLEAVAQGRLGPTEAWALLQDRK